MSTTERLDALERDLGALKGELAEYLRHPVRSELLGMRDVHGARLGAIEARLGAIESGVRELDSWVEQRFDEVDRMLKEVLRRLPE